MTDLPQSPVTQIISQTPPVTTQAPVLPSPQPLPTKQNFIPILLFTLPIVISAGVYYGYKNYLSPKPPPLANTTTATPEPVAVAHPLDGFTPMVDASSLLAYMKDNDKEIYGDEEIILINPATKKETALSIKKPNYVYKYYGSDQLFYLPQNDKGEYHILNLKTGIDQTIDLLDHSDKSVGIMININNITEISPDGRYLVFNGSYNWPCPSMSPFPSGFEGGYGPCGPDESLADPSGYFLYDIQNNKSTNLEVNTFRTSRWDTYNNKLYFVDYDTSSTKSLDLTTKVLAHVDSTSNFGYFVYPLVKSNKIVKFEAATGDNGTGPFGKIYLVDTKGSSEVKIDNTNTWTDIQPFITANPSESDILYRRSTNIEGLHRNSIYRFNVATGKMSRLTKEDKTLSYSKNVSWINDHEIVTSVDVIESTNYTNQNQYLVKIDLNTLEETRLTSHDQVMYFNSQ